MSEQLPIAERLKGAHVFISGATGFLAKVLVEKLLWSVPDVGGLYLLVRPRKGTGAADRVRTEVLASGVMNRLRARHGAGWDEWAAGRVHAVSGDLGQEFFGLSQEDYHALAGKIDLIVGSAATVTFDERLDIAVQLNIQGATRMLALAKDAGNAPYLHVSTCYVSGTRSGKIVEEVREPAGDLDELLKKLIDDCTPIHDMMDAQDQLAEWRKQAFKENADDIDKRVQELQSAARRKKLIDLGMGIAREHGFNDTYTLTKCLAEQFLVRDHGEVPVAILRPAIIEGSWAEPVPGWIDGLRMADPLIVAYGRGKLREFPGNPDSPMDLIPVDFVSNAMVAAMAELRDQSEIRNPKSELPVYQVCSSGRNQLTLGEMIRHVEHAFRMHPMKDAVGEDVVTRPLRLVEEKHFLARLAKQHARAQWLRKVLPLRRWRGMLASGEHAAEQVGYLAKIYTPYTHHPCHYMDDRTRELWERLAPEDQTEFPFDVSAVDWRDYMAHRHVPGIRRHVLGTEGGVVAHRLSGARERTGQADDVVHHSLKGATIFDVFHRAAQQEPDRPSLQIRRDGKWLRYTYGQALTSTANLARLLRRDHGIGRGDRVVLYGENGPEWTLLALAVYRVGGVLVPLDPQWPAHEMAQAAEFTEAKLICASPRLYDVSRDASDNVPVVRLSEPFIPAPEAPLVDEGESVPEAAHGEADLASIIFTSGTTLAPKAVGLTHGNLLSNARAAVQVLRPFREDRFLSVLPSYHVFEFTCGHILPLAGASSITYVSELKGPEIVSLMQETGTSIMLVVPRLLQLFLGGIRAKVEAAGPVARGVFGLMGKLSDLSGGRLARKLFGRVHRNFGGSLSKIVCGGSALDPEVFRAFMRMGFLVLEGYGLTETSPIITVNPAGSPRAGSVGKALAGVDIEIHNRGADGIGEVRVRGPNVMSGYYRNEDATAAVFEDGWFRTGDLGYLDEDGYLFLTGRLKELIVTAAGKNVYPEEVELRYRELPHVKELCVLGMPAGQDEEVHAVAVMDVPAGMDPEAASTAVRMAADEVAQSVPSHQRIARFHFWTDDLPKTSTMKVKRGIVREMLLEAPGARSQESTEEKEEEAGEETVAAGEAWVRKTLAGLTKRPESAITQDKNLLLDLGVDSLMKVELLGQVETEFDLTLTDETIGRTTRVADVLELIGDRQPAGGEKRSWRERLGRRARGAVRRTPLVLLPARWALRLFVTILMSVWTRVRARGRGYLPLDGPFLLAANHGSHLDAQAIRAAVAGARSIRIAGARDYFCRTRFKRFFFTTLFGLIPVERDDSSLEGLRLSLEVLSSGEGLLIFPEGTRSRTGALGEFKPGVGLLAVEAGVPVVPVGISGTHRLMPRGSRIPRPGRITVRFGEPVEPKAILAEGETGYEAYRKVAEAVREAVKKLTR